MTAIIVDDEEHCREVLSTLLTKHCAGVQILATCSSGKEALTELQSRQPDILFLDIEMPGMNGFELLEQYPHPEFGVIFTTAYNEYAIQAIKHSALDYLLKPVDKEELVDAVDRVHQQKNRSAVRIDQLLDLLDRKKNSKRFAVPTLEGLIMIDPEEVIYCESDGPYCTFHFTNSKKLMVSKTLKEAEEVLQGNDFFRIHHSFVVNMKYITKYIRGEGGEVVMNNGKNIPVSRTKKQDFLKMLERM